MWASDVTDDDCLEVAALDGSGYRGTGEPRRIAAGQLGMVLWLEPSPAGDKIAVVSHDGRVLIVTVESGQVRQVGRSAQGEATGLAWSPDGRYLVWRQARDGEDSCGAIFCWDEHGLGESFQLTKGTFDDSNPVFTADGKYLVVLSARTFDPHYDGQTFDLSLSLIHI